MLLVVLVVVVNEKNWKPFEVKSYLAFGKPEAGPAGRSLVLNLLQTKQKQLSILSLPSSLMQESVYFCCLLKKPGLVKAGTTIGPRPDRDLITNQNQAPLLIFICS